MIAAEPHWLASGTDADRPANYPHQWLRHIVRIGRWSVASNAKAMTAICDEGKAAGPATTSGSAPEVAMRAKLLVTPPATAVGIDVRDLAEWCKYPTPQPCRACKGTGVDDDPERSHGHGDIQDIADYTGLPLIEVGGVQRLACPACDGDTIDYEQNTLGWIAGALIDRRLLAQRLVGPLLDSTACMWSEREPCKDKTQQGYSLFLSGEVDSLPWRVVVMGRSFFPTHTPPGTPTYVPGVGALWHLIGEGGRGIVADWLLDRGLDIEQVDPLPF